VRLCRTAVGAASLSLAQRILSEMLQGIHAQEELIAVSDTSDMLIRAGQAPAA
jgi:hypothetical protein